MPRTKAANERLTENAMVMLSPGEKRSLKGLAKREDRTVSYFVRQLILNAIQESKSASRRKAA